jgi:hypothetical protein
MVVGTNVSVAAALAVSAQTRSIAAASTAAHIGILSLERMVSSLRYFVSERTRLLLLDGVIS